MHHADYNQENLRYSGEYANPLWQHHSPNIKTELFTALTVLDYINEKSNKYSTREDALETNLLQDPVLWDVLFPYCGIDQLGNLTVQGSEYRKKVFKIRLSRAQVCIGEKKKDAFYNKM